MAKNNRVLGFIRDIFKRDNMGSEDGPRIKRSKYSAFYNQGNAYSNIMIQGSAEYGNQGGSLQEDLLSRYADYEDMDDVAELCVAKDTLVRTLNGPIRIDELAKKYSNGEKFKILSYDIKNHEFVIGNAHSPRKTKTDYVYQITFDTGDVLKCTGDHKILTRDCRWVEAKDFKIGDSVMPLETKMNSRGYMRVCHPEKSEKSRWEYLYHLVAKAKFGEYERSDYDVHHIDEDKLNDRWDNLELLTKSDHYKIHAKKWADTSANLEWTEERRKKHAERLRGNTYKKGKKWTDMERMAHNAVNLNYKQRKEKTLKPDMLKAIRNSFTLAEVARKLNLSWTTASRRASAFGINYREELGKNVINHKIVSIKKLGKEDVYDLTTDVYHNFVANNIVVHNCTALDIISDDATQTDQLNGNIVHVDAEDDRVSEILNDTFHKNLMINEKIWEICRTSCKYGNAFYEHVLTENDGIVDITYYAPPQIRRVDDEDGSLLGFVYDKSGTFNINDEEFQERIKNRKLNEKMYYEGNRMTNVFEDWEMTHFRNLSRHPGSQYGWSFLEGARWTVKRLNMLEDAALLYKLSRAQQRFVFNVDVGDLPPNEARKYLNQVKQSIKKHKLIDPATGKLDLGPNLWSNQEDFFVAKRKDSQSMEIDTVGGFDSQFYMDDLEYFKDKLYSAIKIPKDYLNFSEDSVSKANLCLVPETDILVENKGQSNFKTMEQLIEDHNNGVQNFVYSINEKGETVLGKVINALWTRKNTKVMRVILNNFSYIDCTPDHPFMLENMEYKQAQDLKIGENLFNNVIVMKIEEVEGLRDTCDITVEKYHNFTTKAGAVVHNSQEDIRWARTVMRVQRTLRTGLINMGRVQLASRGVDPDVTDFDIYLTPPSSIFEMAMNEVRQSQLDIAESYREWVDDYWIFTNILKFTDDEYEEIKERLKKQKESEDPFSENRFPTLENKFKKPMKKEVGKILEDLDEAAVEGFLKDPKVGKRLRGLKGLGEELKHVLKRK